jgi:hypothetical protein
MTPLAAELFTPPMAAELAPPLAADSTGIEPGARPPAHAPVAPPTRPRPVSDQGGARRYQAASGSTATPWSGRMPSCASLGTTSVFPDSPRLAGALPPEGYGGAGRRRQRAPLEAN